MKIITLVRLRVGGESIPVGAEIDVPDGDGESLVRRCWAEPCSVPKSKSADLKKAKRKSKESAATDED